ncbi:PREDICTED: putative F-box protein At3g16820-like [Fragaria vesca subsp. vesca]
MVNCDGQSNHALADDEDLVFEILTRLPVKSLMRFRSVSRPWRALISQSHFIKKHQSHANSGIAKNSSSRVIFLTNPPTFIRLEDLESLSSDGLDLVTPTKLALPVILVGVPLIECEHSFTSFADQTTVQVFALKWDSWNFHEWCGDINTLKGQGHFLNGALHWLEFESLEFQGGSRIMSFHLGEEKFEEIPTPFDGEVIRGAPGGFNGFMTFKNRLCVYSGAFFPSPFTIRMLEKYEDKESWVEILNVDSNVVLDFGDKILYLKPLCILESGEILVDNVEEGHGSVLALYNPDERTSRDLVHNHKHLYFDTIICEETLVSPVIGSGGDNDAAPATL